MRRLITYFTEYPIWANAIILVVGIAGIVSMFAIKKAFFPEIDPNLIVVSVAYPGASPEEMEEGVVNKIEEALEGIQGIEEVTSTASENTASISVEVNPDYEADLVLTDVKNAVDQINSFPVSAEKPRVFNQKPQGDAIDLVLRGEVDLMTLKRYAEGIRDDLLTGEGISTINLSGFPSLEISVEVDEATLSRYNLTFDQVANAVRTNNRDISAGSIKTEAEEILIRSRNKRTDPERIANIILRSSEDGSILRIGDIAKVNMQFADVPNQTFYNGQPAVTLAVKKLPEEDVLIITEYVKAYVDQFNAENRTVQLIIENDRSVVLDQRLGILLNNGGVGLILVLVALGMFLSLRLSFWVAFGIPFSFLGMLIVADQLEVTINLISLFGMILVVGILVDDGIVVAENIYAHFEKGKRPLQAAVDGTMEVLPSVFTGVSTTMLAFSAFFFFEGRFGQFIFEMAVVVILCLAFSLIECALVLPPHLAHSGALRPQSKAKLAVLFDRAFRYARDRVYGKLLAMMIRWRYVVLAGTACMIMILSGLMSGGYIERTFFPPLSFSDNLDAVVVLKPGTREDITLEVIQRVKAASERVCARVAEEQGLDSTILQSTRMDIGSGAGNSGSHVGSLRLTLLTAEEMGMEKFEVAAMIRREVGPLPEAEQFTIGGRQAFGKAVSLSLKSRNPEVLSQAKEFVKEALRRRAELKDITDSNLPGRREIELELTPLAYVLGLTHQDITGQIRQGFFGDEAQRLQIGRDEVRVYIRYPESDRRSLSKLENSKIRSATGEEYLLSDLVTYSTQRGVIDIKHLNGQREVRVEADLADQRTPVQPIIEDIQNNVVPELRSRFPGLNVSFEGQSRRGEEFGSSLGRVFPLIFLGMILLIALSFRSFSQSFLIIIMIPLGLLGAVIGHGLEGKPISILSSYGMLALAGVIVNDAVVFTDKFNRLLRQGLSLAQAMWYAGKSRFRPIILTSLTTVAGLFPLIRDTSSSAQFLIPMAISVAYGVLIGTFFILTIFPALVVAVNDLRVGFRRSWNWLWHGDRSPVDRREVEPAIRELRKREAIL